MTKHAVGRSVALLSLLLPACATKSPTLSAPPTVTSVPAPPAPSWDIGKTVDTLRSAYRAYAKDNDTAPLFALWDANLEVRAARIRGIGDREVVFDRTKFKAVYTWAAVYEAHIDKLTISDVHTERDGDRLVVEWRVRLGTPKQESAFGERYVLVRRGAGFSIVQFRYWPLSPDTMRAFGPDYFKKSDQEVDDALAVGDRRTAAYKLLIAYRFDESSDLIRKVCDEMPDDAWSWSLRATVSAMVGDLEDAKRARAKAKELEGKP